MLRLLRSEALAYVRLGLLAPQRRRGARHTTGVADVGVLFVPGVGANGSQFRSLERALEAHADWFGTFEYFSMLDPKKIARALHTEIDALSGRVQRLVVVGHSLGGLLLRMVLQSPADLDHVAGYVSICAPLEGTWRSRFAPSPHLRRLRPDSPLMTELHANADRLRRWDGRIVTIAARRDQFIEPFDAALLAGTEQVILEDSAHAGSLFDPAVHAATARLLARIRAAQGL